MKISGRILYLADSTEHLRAQLDGEDLSAGDVELAFGVNTDAMISGRACTFGFTPEVLGPFFLHNFLETVGEGEVAAGGFEVVVGGDAYGSGSSREVAVVVGDGESHRQGS